MMLRHRELQGISGHDAGRQLLRDMYRELTGKSLSEILVTQRGKPYFAEDDWHFSISHTKDRVFCVLSENSVGIDAEKMDRQINLELADKILSEKEKRRYEAAADKSKTLLRFWVLKEAAAKCSGEGLRGYPDHTDFDPFDPRVQEIEGCFVAVIQEETHAV